MAEYGETKRPDPLDHALPRRRAPKITEANVLRIAEEMIAFYAEQDTAIQHVRDVVERKNDVGVSKDYQTTGYQVRDGTVTDHVLGTGTMLTANRPQLQLSFPEGGGSKKKQDLVKTLEPATEALVLDDAGRNSETYRRVGMSLAQDGAAWSLVTIQQHRWENVLKVKRADYADDEGYDPLEPAGKESREGKYLKALDKAKRSAKGLISWTYLDPKTVYPIWLGEDELGALIVVTEHPRWTTLAEYGLTLNGDGKIVEEAIGQPQPEYTVTAGETVRKIAHWTAECVFYYLSCNGSAKMVEKVEHGYGFIPVAYSFGWRLPHWSNIKTGWGSAAVLCPAVEYVSHLKTLHANQTAGSIAPPYKRIVPQGLDVVRDPGNNQEVQTQRILPNTIYNLRPGEDIVPFQQAQPSQHLTQQIEMEMQQVTDLRGPVATGNLSDADNGFAIESVKSAGKVKNSPFIQGCADHLHQVTGMVYRLIREQLTGVGPIYVQPRTDKADGLMTIDPEDLADEPRYYWDISPEQPAGAMVEARGYHERMQAGTLGPEAAIERMGDNPAEVFEDILRGQMRQDKLWQEMAKAEMVSEYGRGDLYARFVALQNWAATGAVGPNGEPGMMDRNAAMVGGNMGAGGMPGDFAGMAMTPGGDQTTTMAGAGIGSPVEGAPARVGVPTQAATAQIQSLGPGM